ncbi:M23/M56 family metallopeptidase [uncultured Oscillibacter sp.]|uniref:M23/M56 family metallopeptidase n=1 Tax=uncultured Oscillibacter sp. TaxID=876091 RepID=UPI002636E999|nr:M23/M56 family metallopeptidase [uncultured Oscillibacter sp.]
MTFMELSLSGGVFILAIAAFRGLTLRRLPKGTFVALWWLAAARLLLPVELASRFSVYTLLEALGPKSVPAVPDALPAPVVPAAPSVPAAPPVIAIPAQPAAVPAPAPFPVWTALWLTVGLLLAAWFLIRYVRWRRRFREALPADCPGLETWFQLRRKVEVRVTDQIAAPLTYGLFRPVILLPKTMDFKDEEALTCVLAHERAHIRRLDGLLKLALTAALCLHWFNPAVWLLYVLGNRDMELRCDEAAVLALGEDSRERYALALIRLAENRNVPLCGFAHRNGMEERIKAIMSIKKKSLLACFMALALVLGITTAFATSAKPAETDRPYSEDFTDRDLYAQSSAESAALWEETLAPYEPFGLTWTFDDPDLDGNGLTMTWEGHEVRGIYDEGKFSWITEHAGDGAFGPDAVELYTIYENGKLTGLRLATEEEQKAFDRDRKLSADSLKVETLAESVRYDSRHIYFTIPESEEPWSIFIQGRILLEDGSGQSVRYLEKESEQAEWVPQMTYSFEVADAAYDELTMNVRYGNADYCYPLTPLLPEKAPLPVEPLPEGKADIPEGTEMIWPVESDQINNSFGDRAKPGGEGVVTHTGVDIGGMEKGTPVYAAGKGTVKEAGFNATEGNFVRIDHGNGQETFYAHCEKLLVKIGDAVELGQTIATVGSTGMSTGPHLHFEFWVNGVAQNPEAMLKFGQDMPKAKPEPEKKPEPETKPEPVPAAEPESTMDPVILKAALEGLVDGDYPRNSLGETYGSTLSESIVGYEPDLISAVSEDGTEGYIEPRRLLGPYNSEEEAIACYNWRNENKVGYVLVPLYNSEHEEIGTFMHKIGKGIYSGVITLEEFMEAKAQGWPCKDGSTPIEEEPIFKSLEEAQEAVKNGWPDNQ